MALKLRERSPKSLDEALHLALRLEAWAKDARRKTSEGEVRRQIPEVEVRRNKDRPVARSVDPRVLGASELEDKLVNALNRGMAKWTQELRSMGGGGGTPPNNGGKARPNQPKPEVEAKFNIGGEPPVKKEVNREVATLRGRPGL